MLALVPQAFGPAALLAAQGSGVYRRLGRQGLLGRAQLIEGGDAHQLVSRGDVVAAAVAVVGIGAVAIGIGAVAVIGRGAIAVAVGIVPLAIAVRIMPLTIAVRLRSKCLAINCLNKHRYPLGYASVFPHLCFYFNCYKKGLFYENGAPFSCYKSTI